MQEGPLTKRRPEQIDLPVLWVLVRGAQILLAVIYTKFAYLSVGTDSFGESVFSVIGMLLIIWAFLRGVVTGTADGIGIHYRRYFRRRTVTWADVEEIQWVASRLKVRIKGRGKRRRVLLFLLNPLKTTGSYWAHRLGAEVAPPEILERIHALPIDTPPTIASAPPYSRWILRAFSGLVILLMLVMLYRLLFAASHASH